MIPPLSHWCYVLDSSIDGHEKKSEVSDLLVLEAVFFDCTVDGRNSANHLIGSLCPFFPSFYMPGGAGFLPSNATASLRHMTQLQSAASFTL